VTDPEVEALVQRYQREKAEPGPSRAAIRAQLFDLAEKVEAFLPALEPNRWTQPLLDEVPTLVPINFGYAAGALQELAERAKVAADEIKPGDRRAANLAPGGALWRLLWDLAEHWSKQGRQVGVGVSTTFYSFCADLLTEIAEPVPERLILQVARKYRAMMAGKPPNQASACHQQAA
jgi:hypothetical protein